MPAVKISAMTRGSEMCFLIGAFLCVWIKQRTNNHQCIVHRCSSFLVLLQTAKSAVFAHKFKPLIPLGR